MNAPNNAVQQPRWHPMMHLAALAVTLFCGVGIAAMLGWLPGSIGNSGNNPASAPPQPAALAIEPQLQLRLQLALSTGAPVPHPVAVTAEPSAACSKCGVVESISEIMIRAKGGAPGKPSEDKLKASRSYQVTLRMNNGAARTVLQSEQGGWRSGDRIKFVNGQLRANG